MNCFAWLAACCCGAAFGQVFSPLPAGPDPPAAFSVPGPRPTRGSVVFLDFLQARAVLDAAPLEQPELSLGEYGAVIFLPDPLGNLVPCSIAESPVMQPQLQARFPQIRTYLVQSTDGLASGRLEFSPRGITAMLRSPSGVWMIDPWQSADPAHAVSYWLRDLPGGGDWRCDAAEDPRLFGNAASAGVLPPSPSLQSRRTVRLAMACTGEYGLHHCEIQGHGSNIEDPLAAIVTVVGRANVVYEADMGIHLELVAGEDQLVFFDPATDPYDDTCSGTGTDGCSGNLLTPNIDLLNQVIGSANFDLGHVMTRIAGGTAYLASVCSSNKAGGVSGIPRGGDVDPFSALVAIHEMGHQFGATHTFSGTRGRCASNVQLDSAWEAGSGSSIMAYAGACPVGNDPPTDNVAIFADPYFHHGSVQQMLSFLNGPLCLAIAPSTNSVPVITAISHSVAVPARTPFVLVAAATDADGDVLTYSWEQYDSFASRPLTGTGSQDNGRGALFRIFPPTLEPGRTFPAMADVLSGVPTPGEKLPTVTGVTRQFRVIVRDNHPGTGAAAISSFVNLTIAPGTSAFSVLSPVEGAQVDAGSFEVDWSVGGTDVPPVSCGSVTLSLSIDGGESFPYSLGSFPNTGSAVVEFPVLKPFAAARVRAAGDGNVFFAVSRPFALRADCLGDFDHNGSVEDGDLDQFLGDFVLGLAGADINGDEFVSGDDFDLFVERFYSGC